MLFLILCTFSEDEQAQIEQLFKENHALLYKVSYQLLRSETDAEDAVAQAFLNIMEHFEKISQLSRPSGGLIALLLQRIRLTIFFVEKRGRFL